jgi:hypothetical protein
MFKKSLYKKMISAAIAASMVLSITACGGSDEYSETVAETTAESANEDMLSENEQELANILNRIT